MVVRPTVVCAYGDEGHEWARKVEQLLSGSPVVAPLVKDRKVQFWVLGSTREAVGASQDRSLITRLPPDVTADQVYNLLRGARGSRQGLEPQDVRVLYVFERWSLFDKASVARSALRAAVELGRRIDLDASQSAMLQVQWFSFMDCTRSSGRLEETARKRAAALLDSCTTQERYLLVDGADEDGALISRDMADCIFARIACALISPALVLRAHAVMEPNWPERSGDVATVTPLSVICCDHKRSMLAESRCAVVMSRLSRNPSITLRELGIEDAPRLLDVVAEDFDALRAGKARPLSLDRRRKEAIRALFLRALATGDGGSLSEVALARNEIRKSHSSVRRGVFVADPVTVLGLSSLALGAIAAAAVGAYFIRRRREGSDGSRTAGEEAQTTTAGQLETLRAEWEELLEQLDRALRGWRMTCRNRSASTRGSCWNVNGTLPVACSLVEDPTASERILDSGLYRQIADECTHLLDGLVEYGEGADMLVNEAILRVIRSTPALGREATRAAFGGSHAKPLRDVIASSRLSAFVGAPSIPAAVWWFSNAEHEVAHLLKDLEPPDTKAVVRHHDHGDVESSIRITLARPIPWKRVLSLSKLLENG